MNVYVSRSAMAAADVPREVKLRFVVESVDVGSRVQDCPIKSDRNPSSQRCYAIIDIVADSGPEGIGGFLRYGYAVAARTDQWPK